MLSLDPNKTVALRNNGDINWSANRFFVRRDPPLERCQINERLGHACQLFLGKVCDNIKDGFDKLILTDLVGRLSKALKVGFYHSLKS